MTDKDKLKLLLAHQKTMSDISMIQDIDEKNKAYQEMPELPFSGEEVVKLMNLLHNNDIIDL